MREQLTSNRTSLFLSSKRALQRWRTSTLGNAYSLVSCDGNNTKNQARALEKKKKEKERKKKNIPNHCRGGVGMALDERKRVFE